MKTIATKVNNDVYQQFADKCEKSGITASQKLRELILNEDRSIISYDFYTALEHLKKCTKCAEGLIANGYVLVPVEELKKYSLVPASNRA